MRKRGQIGATLTWFAAFLIIFFIMIIYLSATAALAVARKASVTARENEIGLKEYKTGDLEVQRNLEGFLNSDIDADGSKTMIKNLAKSKLFSEIKALQVANIYSTGEIKDKAEYKNIKTFYESTTGFFDKLYDSCYLMCVYFEEDRKTKFSQGFLGLKCSGSAENIYERQPNYYSYYSCTDLDEGTTPWQYNKGAFEYEEGNSIMRIKLFRRIAE